MRNCLNFLFISVALGLFVIAPDVGYAQGSPDCSAGGDDSCTVETFGGASTGSKGSQYTSPNNFEFDQLDGFGLVVEGPSTLGPNLGNALFFPCDSTAVEFPQNKTYEYVTFVLKGKNDQTLINFVAFDSNGNLVDETVKRNRDASEEGAEVVHLGTGETPIAFVVMHHVNQECDLNNCSEPYISEIRACDKRFP